MKRRRDNLERPTVDFKRQRDNPESPSQYSGIVCFFQSVQREDFWLFQQFSNYEGHLPIRERDGASTIVLHQKEYMCTDAEISEVAERMFSNRDEHRRCVRYIAAPAGAGKTSAVLPLFLAGMRKDPTLKALLYVPFHNNGERQHAAVESLHSMLPYEKLKDFEKLGSWYMYYCVWFTLQGQYLGEFSMQLKDVDRSQKNNFDEKLVKLVKKIVGKAGVLVIHVDEHRRMCDPQGPDSEPLALAKSAFRRGALTFLARCPLVRVVATFVEPPVDLPDAASSHVCRFPVPLPSISARELQRFLKFDSVKTKTMGRHQKVTILVLAQIFYSVAPIRLHAETDDFRAACNEWLKHRLAERVPDLIEKCLAACHNNVILTSAAYEVRHLVGIAEDEASKKRLPQIQTIQSSNSQYGLLCAPLGALLYSDFREAPKWFQRARSEFFDCLICSKHKAMAVDKPLEHLYLWVLAAIAHVHGKIYFKQKDIGFKCNAIERGSIINWDARRQRAELDLESVAFTCEDTFYYAELDTDPTVAEQEDSHPVCDLWFWSTSDILVVIDVTGSSQEKIVREKTEKIKEFAAREEVAIKWMFGQRCGLSGFVVAPNFESDTSVAEIAICGSQARSMLRGVQMLAQPFSGQ